MSNEGRFNLQEEFLNSVRKAKTPVTIHVINGFQLNHLRIVSFDSYAILAVDDKERQRLIYKHAISTISPEIDLSAAAHETSETKETK